LGKTTLHGQSGRNREEIPAQLLLSFASIGVAPDGEDNANHLVSQVTAGQIESSDVQVQNVTITTMSEEMLRVRESPVERH